MARGQRDRVKERHWRRHVAAWRRSGQSVRAHCEAEGLSEASFYAWRRVLAERRQVGATRAERIQSAAAPPPPATSRSGRAAPGSGAATAAAATVAAFVPVRLVEDAASASAVEVVLRGGRVVRVAAGFAAQTLRAVVATLEDLPC